MFKTGEIGAITCVNVAYVYALEYSDFFTDFNKKTFDVNKTINTIKIGIFGGITGFMIGYTAPISIPLVLLFDAHELRDNKTIITNITRMDKDKDRKSTRLNSSHTDISRMPSSA